MPCSRQHRCPNIGERRSGGMVPTEVFIFLPCCLWSPKASAFAAVWHSHEGREHNTENFLWVAQIFPVGSTLICGYGPM